MLVLAGVATTGASAGRERYDKELKVSTELLLWEMPALRQVLRERNVHNAFVFIGPWPHGFGAMPNGPRWDDDVVFARDQGLRNGELAALLTGRRVLRCNYGVLTQRGLNEGLTDAAEFTTVRIVEGAP